MVALPLHASDIYVRGGMGRDRSARTVLRDRDCESTQPPALFGCGFEARGEIGEATRGEIAIGVAGSNARVELALSHRHLDLRAESNFTGVPGDQPVSARGRSRSAMLVGSVGFGRRDWKPFVTFGAGAANHELKDVVFTFPGIAADAVTAIQGGEHTAFAWMAGAGVAVPLGARLHIDFAIRHHDSGEVRTDTGPATIVRPRGTFVIDIDGTRGEVESIEVMVSVRYRL